MFWQKLGKIQPIDSSNLNQPLIHRFVKRLQNNRNQSPQILPKTNHQQKLEDLYQNGIMKSTIHMVTSLNKNQFKAKKRIDSSLIQLRTHQSSYNLNQRTFPHRPHKNLNETLNLLMISSKRYHQSKYNLRLPKTLTMTCLIWTTTNLMNIMSKTLSRTMKFTKCMKN